MIKIIYRGDTEETAGINEMQVEKLNNFEGANIPYMQVLKSAVGYYIGELSKAEWSEEEFWEPNLRDSACYWATREEAEQALRTNNYPVKF